MFAYCSNNPVLFQDANGYCRRVGPNDIKILDCGLSSCRSSNNFASYTVSVGVSVAVGVGPLTLGGQISVVTDATGKSELQMSYTSPNLLPWEYPSVGDMFSVIKENGFKIGGSAMLNVAVTNAPTVESLHGPAMSSGIYGPGVAVDCSVIPNAYANVPNYQGLAISGGLCTSGVSLSASDTAIAIPVNYSVYDLVRKSCHAMWGIYE